MQGVIPSLRPAMDWLFDSKSHAASTLKNWYTRVLRLWAVLQGRRISLLRMIALGGVAQLLSVIVPYFQQRLIDRAYPSHDISLTHLLVLASLTATATTLIVRNLQSYFNTVVTASIQRKMGVEFYDHVQHLPMSFFEQHRSGEIASRFQDVRFALRGLVTFVQSLTVNGVYLLLVPPFLFAKNAKLAAVALISIPVTAYLCYKQSVASYNNAKRHAELNAERQAFQTETFINIGWIKALGLEGHFFRRFGRISDDVVALQTKISRTDRSYGVFIGLSRLASLAVSTWWGWQLILSGDLTLGQFLAFITYLGYLHSPIAELVSNVSTIQETLVALDRIREFQECPREDRTWPAHSQEMVRTPDVPGECISLESVSFGYSSSDLFLRGLTASFEPGKVYAIMGPSGIGKTSLFRLLVGFDRPVEGTIRVFGRPTSEFTLPELRSRITVVWQDPGFLRASLWENLTLGLTECSVAKVDHIMELCQLSDLVRSLPQGYQTIIGENGMTLSAGQRQRIGIAQALLRDTPIILFDEVTANLDIATERKLLAGLFAEFPDRLIIFATHRKEVALLAHTIYTCEYGTLRNVTQDLQENEGTMRLQPYKLVAHEKD